MVHRTYWQNVIENAWSKRSVLWLSGIRRIGKTCLCQSLPDIEYFDCELPRIRRLMEDPEGFLRDLKGKRVVIDEVHRLDNPSELLKVAADHFPNIKVLATGSSTLGASSKFKDTLTGRKTEIRLTPMIYQDLLDFGNSDFKHRLLHGGLPPFFMSQELPEHDFQEWMDSYWAKDIQELFRLERRHSFYKFAELLMMQSGGIFEATRFATRCEASRGTISNYLGVMEMTHLVLVIRPFSTHRPTEIVAMPKVYSSDTGFICYQNGWQELRSENLGLLWEHFVLTELVARLQSQAPIHFWRDKRGHEVDFVILKRGTYPIAVECKWSVDSFDPTNIKAFRRQYPDGDNFVVCQDVDRSFQRTYENTNINFISLESIPEFLA
ncbi:MAG TPA: AAA family ATPase [Armatimonadota bacterium]|nr:AAA family ATPase [Armatimonadota bacterium]